MKRRQFIKNVALSSTIPIFARDNTDEKEGIQVDKCEMIGKEIGNDNGYITVRCDISNIPVNNRHFDVIFAFRDSTDLTHFTKHETIPRKAHDSLTIEREFEVPKDRADEIVKVKAVVMDSI